MRITKSRLRQIVREEASRLTESGHEMKELQRLHGALNHAANIADQLAKSGVGNIDGITRSDLFSLSTTMFDFADDVEAIIARFDAGLL